MSALNSGALLFWGQIRPPGSLGLPLLSAVFRRFVLSKNDKSGKQPTTAATRLMLAAVVCFFPLLSISYKENSGTLQPTTLPIQGISTRAVDGFCPKFRITATLRLAADR